MTPSFDPAPILRAFTGRTVQEIAAAIGVHTNTVTAWRRGQRLRPAQADRIACHVLGVNPACLWPDWNQT